jgi:hypothetical protein
MGHGKAFWAAFLLVTVMSASCGKILGLDDYHAVMKCMDGVHDEKETDVDCGGTDCMKCPAGKKCALNADCESANCTQSMCTP